MRNVDLNHEKKRIISFIKDYMLSSGFSKGIIGISGGLDSSVVAALAVEALGKEKVTGVMMPYKKSNPNSLNDALLLASKIAFNYRIIDITPMVDSWFDNYEPEASKLRQGNYMARIRMTVLYDLSSKDNALVIGTGNFSELMTGYTTQYGDNACAFEPIGHLYKTEVRKLAKLLNIPSSIVDKHPSADLWKGQTDESELGISYCVLDQILHAFLEKKMSKEKMIESGFNSKDIDRVVDLYKKSEYKRNMPSCLK